ncbi:MAG: MCE family protein [Candidatus Tectomicrobia bacterium]|nr:MCE family protein [Candidatus Tectomicrobia bacterium]
MEQKVSYTLIGLFVILLGAVLFSIVLWLGGGDYRTTYDRYYAYIRESVSGLSLNAPVKYRGVEVGRVKEILLRPENPEEVQLTLEIVRGTPIKEDTVATLSSQGLTGIAYVELTGGSRESPLLKARKGEPYPVIEATPSLFVRIDQAASALLANLNLLFTDLHNLVNQENFAPLKQLLTNVANLSQALEERHAQFDQLFSSAVRTVENTERISAQLPALLTPIAGSARALEGMAQEIARTSETINTMLDVNRQHVEHFTGQTLSEMGLLVTELRQLSASLQRLTQQDVGNLTRQILPEMGLLMTELRQLGASLQRLTQQLEQEPSSLLFGKSPLPPGPGE